MDTNTPKNVSADINIVEKLCKKRFGIDATASEQAYLFLQQPYDWVDSDDGRKFYKYAPEFTLENISAENSRNDYEFYLFNQCDSCPCWYDINTYYHQTLLYSLGGVALEYTVHQFYIADDIDEEQTARKKFLECIPICRNPELRKKAAVNLLTK